MLLMVSTDYYIVPCPRLTCPVGLTGKKEGKTRLMNLVMQVGSCGYSHGHFAPNDTHGCKKRLDVRIYLMER
jgi:hypothetical protein